MRTFNVALCALVCPLVALTPAAKAQQLIVRQFVQNGGSACTGVGIQDEIFLRKSPLSIRNIGTHPVTISCSLIGDVANPTLPRVIYAYFSNHTQAPVRIDCTAFMGDFRHYTTSAKSVVVPPIINGQPLTYQNLAWYREELTTAQLSLRCALPPQLELNQIGQVVDEWQP